MDFEAYFKLYNMKDDELFKQQYDRLKSRAEWKSAKNDKVNAFKKYLADEAAFLCHVIEYEAKCTDIYFNETPLDVLREDEQKLYAPMETDYAKSYLNPDYAVATLGKDLGAVLSSVSYRLRENLKYAKTHMRFMMCEQQGLFLDICEMFDRYHHVSRHNIVNCIRKSAKAYAPLHEELYVYERYIFNGPHFDDVIRNADLADTGYLFRYPLHVTKSDETLSSFMNTLSEREIHTMAASYVDCFRKSFFADGKDFMRKSSVGMAVRIGMERFYRECMNLFEQKMHYHPYVFMLTANSLSGQCDYDHQFDQALLMDAEYEEIVLSAHRKALEEHRDVVAVHGGRAWVEAFGDPDFEPKACSHAIKMNEEQSAIFNRIKNGRLSLRNEFMPESETSFTIVAYPTPGIGAKFEQIFREVKQINTSDSDTYLKTQQYLIDALDRAKYVEVLGTNGNETNIQIAMQPIADAKKQTNFYNCVADCNIPAGEVFTSPQLKRTSGVLHLSSFSKEPGGIVYKNLKLTFQDGYIADFSCTNFDSESENKELIRKNLLFPYDTLPMGEFAIGTNTEAFAMAMKHDIIWKLPILIVEKTGPHFAIGDTCYTDAEDVTIYNPASGKEIVARENEKTAQRKTDRDAAYTHIHTDLTLPYHEIGAITAVDANGLRTKLIENGRFVLPGTENLNAPLDDLEKHG